LLADGCAVNGLRLDQSYALQAADEGRPEQESDFPVHEKGKKRAMAFFDLFCAKLPIFK
jgi:hypothetical protein